MFDYLVQLSSNLLKWLEEITFVPFTVLTKVRARRLLRC